MADTHDAPTTALPAKAKDETGKRYGMLTAVRYSRFQGGKTYWEFRCECGGSCVTRIDMAKDGSTRSCGCAQRAVKDGAKPVRLPGSPPLRDLAGQRFGRWAVVSEQDRIPGKKMRRWLCRCDCGQEKTVPQTALLAGKSTSCGCFHKEGAAAQARAMGTARRTHGRTFTPEWLAWKGMHDRCSNPKYKCFHRYGGRGVSVCGKWADFAPFLADMGERPSPRHSLGRIDNDAGYSPENCRWETPIQQQRNRSDTIFITHEGVTQCAAAWADSVGMPRHLLYSRLKKGWPFARAISTPPTPFNERRAVARSLTSAPPVSDNGGLVTG